MSQEPTAVLLVEDDAAFAEFAARIILSIAPDYHVVHEPTLARALVRLEREPCDAVLLDLGLPDSDGLEALVAVSAHAPSVAVVVLTSRSDESFARRALQEGAQDYVIKSDADPALLVKCIRYAIERKRAMESLSESERRYRLMFESSPEPMWVVDVELMRFLAVNDAAVQVYGYSREEFIGKSVAEIYGGDRSPVQRSAAASPESSHTMTAVHQRKDGSLIDVRLTSHPLQFGERAARLVIAQNVTDQLRNERRLRLIGEASAILDSRQPDSILDDLSRLIVESIADFCAVVRLNDDGSPGQVHVAQNGGEPADVTSAVVLLPDDYRHSLQQGNSLLMRDVSDGSGSNREWTSVMMVPLKAGGRVSGAMVLALAKKGRFYDADDLTTAEDLARRTALALDHIRVLREARELFDGDLTGNFVAAPDGTLLDCNPAFARMLGFASVDDALASSATVILGGDVNWRGFLEEVVRNGRVRQREIALRTRDGALLHVLVSATGLFNDDVIATIRGQFYDLTAHKQLEEQLSQSQKLEAVGRLAGGIAHDFNNLLTVIGGQADGLLERLRPDDPIARNAKAIAAAADRATGLTQQLLAFSRRQVMSPQILSLSTVVRKVHGMLERVIGEHITCNLSLASGMDNVRADPGRIEQALVNLTLNARDAMPDGGELTISTSVVELDEVYARQHVGARPGRYVMLAVSDTGVGMAPETSSRAFEPFFTTKDIGKGTGLGLSMVYGIVKQSGGYIWVYSEIGIGTTFKIYLPAVDAPVEEPTGEPESAVPTGTETVLLVEDEDGVRELLQEILISQGYRVLAASRGAEALQISEATEEEIPVLVTDVVMPNMSGRELATRLRARRPALRVLYLSGYTEEAIAHHGVIEPDAAFLQKPFTRADLARKIREVLATRVEQ